MPRAAILDIDGTLVDTNYHHALAWYRAFRKHGFVLPFWRIHRAIGMGGDQLLPALVGDKAAEDHGEAIREAESREYEALIDEAEPLAGARELLVDLEERGLTIVLASSAKEHELDHYLDLLDAREVADAWTSSADVERTKPNPDLVHAALEKAGTDDAVMLGDTGWDVEAAARAGIPTACVLTGGWSADELRAAGAVAVYESVEELRARLPESPFSSG